MGVFCLVIGLAPAFLIGLILWIMGWIARRMDDV
jgi:hypothetical protein